MARKTPLIKLSPYYVPLAIGNYGGGPSTFQKKDVLSSHLRELASELEQVLSLFEQQSYISLCLVSVRYQNVTPKSRRIAALFGRQPSSSSYVVGSRFCSGERGIFHVVTYGLPVPVVKNSITLLNKAADMMDKFYCGVFKNEFMSKEQRARQTVLLHGAPIKKTMFFQIMSDTSNVVSFFRYESKEKPKSNGIVTFFSVFKGKKDLLSFLSDVGIDRRNAVIDNATAQLSVEEIDKVLDLAPFLVAQTTVDISLSETESATPSGESLGRTIEDPSTQASIGVIDTMFEKGCYLDKWVTYVNALEDVADNGTSVDQAHGTTIDSIIIDGPWLNPDLDDGCGRFRVKHYAYATDKTVYFDLLIRDLEDIIRKNADIKIWNISLGDRHSVDKNYISVFGAKLDELSVKYSVLFVVAGTNLDKEFREERVGSPADSMNAIVVNSVNRNGERADYSRCGPVLTLFRKPDVCYYGGTDREPIMVYSPTGDYRGIGTSVAAPWIARKLAYLVYVLHMNIWVAKAMIIDAAAQWNEHPDLEINKYMGYGIVPIRISDVYQGRNNEIKLILCGTTKEKTITVQTIPVPLDSDSRFHYKAKATLCYATQGHRNQGVDYSGTEISLKLGRMYLKKYKDRNSMLRADSINKDRQGDDDDYTDEQQACVKYQKWSNVKHLVQPITKREKAVAPKANAFWGIEIGNTERYGSISAKEENSLRPVDFGIVITFRRIDGIDANTDAFMNEAYKLNLNPTIVYPNHEVRLYEEEMESVEWDK